MFKEKRAADMAVYFLHLAEMKKVDRFDILKFLYAAERESLKERLTLFTGDTFCSMKMGPVMSGVYDCIKGKGNGTWRSLVTDYEGYFLGLTPAAVGEINFNEEDLTLIKTVWEKYKKILDMSLSEKVDFMHKEFPEWQEPVNGVKQTPLPVASIIHEALGVSEERAISMANLITNAESIRNIKFDHAC